MKIIVALISVALLTSCAYGAEVGKITFAEGRVDILSAGSDKGVPAIDGTTVSVGDFIRTKSNSKAEVTFFDKSVMRVAQNSKVNVVDYQLDANNMRKSAEINLERGRARTSIAKMKDSAEFKIGTPNAKGTVKGSNVFTSFQAGNSSMLVTEGTLSVFNPACPQNIVSVPAGNAVLIPLAEMPKGPRKYLEAEEKFNEQDTNIPDTISSRKNATVIRGTIAKFTGDVQVTPKGASHAHAAKQGEVLNEGDKITTGADGIVEISLDNGNAIYLKSNTDITILRLVRDPKTGEFENLFQADKGDVKARIEGLKGKSTFEVRTPTGICGARGTIMFVHIALNGATNSFFEGGTGYTTNLISGSTLNVNAGSGANTDAGGGVTGSGPLSDDDRAGMGDGFDPDGGTGDTGGTDGEGMSDLGGDGNTGGISDFVDTTENSEDDTFDTDVVDVPITVADENLLEQPGEGPRVGDFFYAALDASGKPYLVNTGGGMFNFGADAFGGDDSNDFSPLWSALISPVDVNISGNFVDPGDGRQYHIWTTDELVSYNSDPLSPGYNTFTTSDGGAFYSVMGGTIDTGVGGMIKALAIGLYIDANGNAGVFFGSADGNNDGVFILDGTGSFWVDRVYDYTNNKLDGAFQSPTALLPFSILPEDLYTHIRAGNNLTGEGYVDFVSGEIAVKLVDGFGAGFAYDVMNDSDFGIWGARLAGLYKGTIPLNTPWNMSGKSIINGFMDGALLEEVTIDTWSANEISGTLEGIYISLDWDGTVRAGRLAEGRIVGNYVDIDPLLDPSPPGTWQAVACGEWVEETQLYSGNLMEVLIGDIDAAQPGGGFSGLNPNTLITVTESPSMSLVAAANHISNMAMDMRVLESVAASNNGIWAATISGVYSAAPVLYVPMSLSDGSTGSANFVFTQWDTMSGNWSANVVDGTTGSKDFSGIAKGTIDTIVSSGSITASSGNFSGAAVGTWETPPAVIVSGGI